MKNTMLFTMMMVPLVILSQTKEKNPCKRLEKGYQWMKDSLPLTTEQQTKILVLKTSACSSLNVARAAAGTDKEKFKVSAREIMHEFRLSARKELTPEQNLKLKMARKKAHKKDDPTPEKRATNMTNRMKSSLGLDSAQVPKVYASNLQFVKCQAAVKAKKDAGADSASLRREMMTCAKDQRSRLKVILTADQWTRYEALQKEKRGEVRERKQNKRSR